MIEARQYAWLMTKPKGEEKTRLDLYREAEVDPPFPSRWGGEYLVNAFFEVGPISMDRPINWQEIDAYSRLTGADFEPWEAKALSEMSKAYFEECTSATDPLSIEPLERNYE